MAQDWGDRIFRGGTAAGAVILSAGFVLLVAILTQRAAPAFSAFGPGFLWSGAWDPAAQQFGALPYIYGTLGSSLIALAVAVPVAIGTAIALAFLLPRWLAGPIGVLVELTAAVPSIVFGVWALYTIAPWVRDLSGGASFGPSLLAAGLVLAAMVLPIITAVARDMLKSVSRPQRDAALALGATPWEVTWKVVLPNARGGLVAAVLLGLGRAIGETMAVILVVGNQPVLNLDPLKPAATMASVIANEFGDPSGELHASSLVALGLVLLGLSLLLNLAARGVVRRLAPEARA